MAVVVLMFAGAPSVFAYTQPTDLRKSFAGLVGLVERELGQTVESGHLYLFFNRRRNSLKVLFFTGDGLAIFYRRLERGTFEMPQALAATDSVLGVELRMSELAMILEGIELSSVRHRRRWRREVASA
jgi:transposase